MSNLNSKIQAFASAFTNGLIQALRGMSLADLYGEDGPTAGRKARAALPTAGESAPAAAAKRTKKGRRVRRGPEDFALLTRQVITALSAAPDGLRMEQLRAVLQCDAFDLTRPLTDGLASGVFLKTGQKRSTTYRLGAAGKRAVVKGAPSPAAKTAKKAAAKKAAAKKAVSQPKKSAAVKPTTKKATAKPKPVATKKSTAKPAKKKAAEKLPADVI